MRNIITIVSKEIKVYLASPMAYVVTILYIMINSFFFSYVTVNYRESDLKGIFVQQNIFFLLFIIPAITMRLFAEERRMGTIELLLTSPVREWELVLGKYFSGLCMFLIMISFTIYYPFIIFVFGEPEISVIISGYLGLILVASFFVSIGVFASSLTQNQILSFVISFIIIFFFWIIKSMADVQFFATVPYAKYIFKYLGMGNHFDTFALGVIDTSNIFYFAGFSFIFLYFSKIKIESRKWN